MANQFKEYLQKYGIKPSTIRIKILDYFYHHRTHPTAEEIYQALLAELPTLSRASIYNTLDLFLSRGLLKTLPTEDRETHYDMNLDFHGHFECEKCGKIYDFSPPAFEHSPQELQGFVIHSKEMYYRGICAPCLHKKP